MHGTNGTSKDRTGQARPSCAPTCPAGKHLVEKAGVVLVAERGEDLGAWRAAPLGGLAAFDPCIDG